MDIKITAEDGFQFVEITGRLDAANSSEIQEKLMNILVSGNNKMLACMENVDYISSSGLRLFLAVAKKIGTNGFLKFCCLKPSVNEVFTISGFNTIFGIYASKQEAIESMH